MTEHRAEIERAAAAQGLDPDLVEAIVLVESGGNPWAFNPEPQYRYVVDAHSGRPFRTLTGVEIEFLGPPRGFPTLAGDSDQEWWSQKASWGLMQVMGAVARELGCRLPYLSQLCDPAINLLYGCKQFVKLLAHFDGEERCALAAYNGGIGGVSKPGPQAYALKVGNKAEQIRRERA